MNVELRRFVKDECANYFLNSDNISNYCCLENTQDYTCTYYLNLNEESESQNNNNRCGYFEKNVLPMNKDFEVLYNAQIINNDGNKLTSKQQKELKEDMKWAFKKRKKCERENCDTIFPANSNRQKYCDKCKKIIRAEQYQNKKKKELS